MPIYHLFANKINLGDYLSALGIKTYFPKKKSIDLVWDGVEKEKTKSKIANLTENDSLIVGGGGLFKDFFAPVWEEITQNNKCSLIIWGVGICDHKFQNSLLPASLIQSIIKRATIMFVRDERTKAWINDFGGRTKVVGCPSTNIARTWRRKGNKYLLHVVHPDLLKETLSPWRKKSKELADELGLNYVEIDHIIPNMKLKRYIKMHIIRRYYETADLIISSRLHGIILGSAQEVPIVPVSNDFKIESYWKGTLGGENVLNVNEYDSLKYFIKTKKYGSPKKILKGVDKVVKMNNQASLEILELLK